MEKNQLIEIIKNLPKRFSKNEIAFLALTSKIENPLRDKIAFELQEKLFQDYLVCRECRDANHKKSDIAILRRIDKKLCHLIEFKAKSVQSYQKLSAEHLQRDLIKMSNAASNKNPELYFIFFNNCIESKIIDDFSTKPVKYLPRINRTIISSISPIRESIENNWIKYLTFNRLPLDRSDRIDINAGKYYGIPVSIITFVYGPIFKNELRHIG